MAVEGTRGRLYVGTSGFSYTSWRDQSQREGVRDAVAGTAFYPAGARSQDFLRLYAERLPSVELNATFYRLPSEAQLEKWAAQTPAGFRFAVKMSRRITHFGGLDLLPTFCERVRLLGDRLGPVLVQFPPSRTRDEGLLRLLLDSLDPWLRYAFEFRHPSWDGVDLEGHARVGSLEGDAPFRYLRLREPPYDDAALAAWAARLRPLLASGIEVYAYFKHEEAPDAPAFAQKLLQLAHQRV